jgi:hypothetical protein
MKVQLEYTLQKQVCNYIRMQYKDVIFLSDTIASTKLTMGQATRNKAIQKEGFKCPDIIILHPNKIYHGLFIELKISSPFLKSGLLPANEHIRGQAKTINDLNMLNYYATFAWSFDMAKEIIDSYMNQK